MEELKSRTTDYLASVGIEVPAHPPTIEEMEEVRPRNAKDVAGRLSALAYVIGLGYEELDVRLEQNGRKNHEGLPTGVRVTLNAGDLLVFSANMIHRGIYGMDRLSLDILFCDPVSELVKFVDDGCLPDSATLGNLENASAFESAIQIKNNNKAMHEAGA